MNGKLNKDKELEIEIRNKLTLPLTILTQLQARKNISQESIDLAISNLSEIIDLFNTYN